MLKQAMVGLSLLAASSMASAAFIVTDSVTGADMAGITVTATFGDGSTGTAVWEVTGTTMGTTGNPIVDAEGMSGAAIGADWSLSQAGNTFGDFDGTSFFGDWVLDNDTTQVITGISINGWLGESGGIVFDVLPVEEGTAGSGVGRPPVSDFMTAVFTTSSPLMGGAGDLFYTLDIDFGAGLDNGASAVFLMDTDAVSVPAPATLGLVLGGVLLLARKKIFS
ncbi:hypothetical protein PN836_020450 [Ningiella sp. W23]|uniref:hypothetical protein n=1 Tax=Ningiella sp. W23 TaxID=3023715 RepID=UPI003757DFB2